jgi:hypothetical protein
MLNEFTAPETTPAVAPRLGWPTASLDLDGAEQTRDDGESQPAATESSPTITTAKVGTNADLFPDILRLYVPEGSVVADVTLRTGRIGTTEADKGYLI